MEISTYLIPFEECDMSMVDRVGGKCASLGELLRAQIPVPPGFAITTETYKQFLAGQRPDRQGHRQAQRHRRDHDR